MKLKVLVGFVVLFAIALPAQARAGGFGGVVVSKQVQRGTFVLIRSGGGGLTVRGAVARTTLGDRVRVEGSRLRDGTVRASSLRVVARTHRVVIRGVVVRRLAGRTLVATARSVIVIRGASRAAASASEHGELRIGERAEFRVRIGNGLFEVAPPTRLGQVGDVRIEGAVVTVSPLVVSVEGLPIPIIVPAGVTLPATLGVGMRVELTVHVVAAGSFTLVAIDEVEDVNANPAGAEEVRVEGVVVSSTVAQLVVATGGAQFTFAAPSGVTLPVVTPGTRVEVRGRSMNGVLTLERLKVEEGDEGSGGGDDGGGGH